MFIAVKMLPTKQPNRRVVTMKMNLLTLKRNFYARLHRQIYKISHGHVGITTLANIQVGSADVLDIC